MTISRSRSFTHCDNLQQYLITFFPSTYSLYLHITERKQRFDSEYTFLLLKTCNLYNYNLYQHDRNVDLFTVFMAWASPALDFEYASSILHNHAASFPAYFQPYPFLL